MERFTKMCLGIIILLLAVIAAKPQIFPQYVNAAQSAKRYNYVSVITNNSELLQPELDKYSADGWELTSAFTSPPGHTILIFRR